MIAGDPVAAERYARRGYEAFRAMGQHGEYVASLATLLAAALYEQGRFDEAQQLIDQAKAEPSPGGFSPWLIEAKLLARRSQFDMARRLVDQVEALPATSVPLMQADTLRTRAEVERLAGAPGPAAASLRAALDIYEHLRATNQAGQVRAALASLAAYPGGDPA